GNLCVTSIPSSPAFSQALQTVVTHLARRLLKRPRSACCPQRAVASGTSSRSRAGACPSRSRDTPARRPYRGSSRVDAALVLFEHDAAWLAGVVERVHPGTGSARVTAAPSVAESYCMVAPAMSLLLHERGNHAVWGDRSVARMCITGHC